MTICMEDTCTTTSPEERVVITCTDTTGAIFSTAAVGRTRFTARMEPTVYILSRPTVSTRTGPMAGRRPNLCRIGDRPDRWWAGRGFRLLLLLHRVSRRHLQTGLGSGGHAAGDTYRSIEDVYGSSYNDLLIGNGAFNEINGYSGDDVVRAAPAGTTWTAATAWTRSTIGARRRREREPRQRWNSSAEMRRAISSSLSRASSAATSTTRWRETRRRTGCSATRATTSASGWTETTPSRATTGTTRSTAASATTFASAARAPTS